MKKILVATVALSLTLSTLAKAERIQDEVPRTLGQNVDAFINHSEKEIAEAMSASQAAAQRAATHTEIHTELLGLNTQLQAYRAAKVVSSPDGSTRLVVALATGAGIMVPASGISVKMMYNGIKAARFIPGVGKVVAGVLAYGAGIWLTSEVGTALLLSPEQLKVRITDTKARIAQLEAQR